jgi:serine/threonine protein kinase
VREGDRFDHYLLKEKIASGGMAEVFRAERIGVMGVVREVCIKCVRPELCTDAEFVQMFIDEARLSTQLQHANIVAVDHFGQHEGSLFMCMEWVHGTDVAQLLKKLQVLRRAFPIDAAVFVVGEVLRALEYAHAKKDRQGTWLQIVHRDVTPHNVMVSFAGDVKLTDFGIAKASSRLHRTVGDTIKGKVAYMAPEQALGEFIDHRCDLFAVGVMAYELLAGRKPYVGAEDVASVHAMLRSERPPLRTLRPEVPLPIVAVIDRLLENVREARFEDAASVRDALDSVPGMVGGHRTLQRLLRELYPDEQHSTILPRFVDPLPEAITEPIYAAVDTVGQTLPSFSEGSITERDDPTLPLDTLLPGAPSRTVSFAALASPAPSSLTPPTPKTLPPRPLPQRWPLTLAVVSFVLATTALVTVVKSIRRPVPPSMSSSSVHQASSFSTPLRTPSARSSSETPVVADAVVEERLPRPLLPSAIGSESTEVPGRGPLGTLSVVVVPRGKITVAGRTAHNRGTFHLPPGRYHIRVEHPDMTSHERTVRLRAGEHETLHIHLSTEGPTALQPLRHPAMRPVRHDLPAGRRPSPLLSIP